MDRRAALKGMAGFAALGGAALAPAPAEAAARKPRKSGWDAIIVGGGFAGVTAARDLSRAGLKTLLIEARPRLGGRTQTAPFAGHRIEVGGTWIGSGQPHVWAERTRYNLALAESAGVNASHYVWYGGGKRYQGGPDQYWPAVTPAYDAFYAPARTALPRPYEPLFAADLEKLDALSAGA
jgi:pseudooxynicotine oxidase